MQTVDAAMSCTLSRVSLRFDYYGSVECMENVLCISVVACMCSCSLLQHSQAHLFQVYQYLTHLVAHYRANLQQLPFIMVLSLLSDTVVTLLSTFSAS